MHICGDPDDPPFLPGRDRVSSAPIVERDNHGFPMSETGTVEECVEDLDEFVATHEHYPPAVLAIAFRAHLAGLLQVLRERGDWSADQMSEFLQDLVSEVQEPGTE